MKNYIPLDSEKYYQEKTKSEYATLRRQQAGEAIKMFILSSIILAGFTFACIALCNSPEVVLNAVESLKDQGLWPR